VLVAGALVAGAGWYLGSNRTVAVPPVVNLSVADAEAKLAPVGLSLNAEATGYSESVPAGEIISTDPAPGAEVREGTTIDAVVSLGLERYAVPTLVGRTVPQASTLLADSSLTVGKQTQVYDDAVAKGLVLSSTPPAGQKLKRGQSVALVVSRGPAPVTIPRVAGKPVDVATASLTKLGLTVTTTEEYSKTVATGLVISSTPKAGVSVPKTGTVALVVSKGPPLVTVPDVYRTAEAEARKAFTSLGLKVSVSYPIGITPFGLVVRQSVKAGTQIPWGTTVSLEVV
jgi:serine/threonine-protein kinase